MAEKHEKRTRKLERVPFLCLLIWFAFLSLLFFFFFFCFFVFLFFFVCSITENATSDATSK